MSTAARAGVQSISENNGVPLIYSGPYQPSYATPGSSGFDLRSYSPTFELEPGDTCKVSTGLSFKIPDGFEIQIRPRSGLASKGIVAVFGTVDSDYRGEILVNLHNQSDKPFVVETNDRIAQAVLAPVWQARFIEGEVLEDTERGSGGFGSTGYN